METPAASPNAGLGATLHARAVERLLAHLFERSAPPPGSGQRSTPLCLWGPHGIGKTALVEHFARSRGWGFAYCAPAQFEELGDLHGLPVLEEVRGQKRTRFAPPAWVPTEPGPGVLLLDDLNRADDRILRGLMQLLQLHALASWALPAGWHIVATCNPDTGAYSVTPLDDAMLTRMVHATMRFDVRDWARWAQGAQVDPRGVAFVCAYPELAAGGRTTPRSLTQFFALLRGVTDLRAERELVQHLAQSALDDAAASAFMSFVDDELEALPAPDELLALPTRDALEARVKKLAQGPRGARRLDRLGALCTRLYALLCAEAQPLAGARADRLADFLSLEALPADLCVALHRDLLRDAGPVVRAAVERPELSRRVLGAL